MRVLRISNFFKKTFFKDCNKEIEIKKMFQNYKTIKVKCPDKNGFELLMRVKMLKNVKYLD